MIQKAVTLMSNSSTLPEMEHASTKIETEKGHDHFILGLVLALTSTIFIGASFVIQKIALIKLGKKGNLRAGSGGYGYLLEWLWWVGFMTMSVGELANFAAYAFAPASLVTPLGALSVLFSTILASKWLGERLNLLGKLGCILCILGSCIIVIHAPKEENIESLEALYHSLESSSFAIYVATVVVTALLICCYFGPRYGDKYVIVYIILCSVIGSVTVVLSKGLGVAIRESSSDKADGSNNSIIFFFFVIVVFSIVVQMNYLNKALDLFSTTVVTPVYYVLFTSSVIVASTIAFDEWSQLTIDGIFGSVCGISVVIIAVFMLNAFKDVDLSLGEKGLLKTRHV